jgi:hypothetical protein
MFFFSRDIIPQSGVISQTSFGNCLRNYFVINTNLLITLVIFIRFPFVLTEATGMGDKTSFETYIELFSCAKKITLCILREIRELR